MCQGRPMSNRNTYSHTVIREIGCIKAHIKKWTNERTKKWTKPCANQSSKFLTALTLVFAGAFYAHSSWAWPKFSPPKISLPNIPPPKLPNIPLPNLPNIPLPNLKPPTTVGGLTNSLNPLGPLIAVATGNGNLDQGPIAAAANTVAATGLAVAVAPADLILGVCGNSECDSARNQLKKEVASVTGPEPQQIAEGAEKEIKKELNFLGDVCSLGEDGRKRDREREEEKEERQRVVRDGERLLRNEQISQTRRLLNAKKYLIATLELLDTDNEVIYGIVASNNKIVEEFVRSSGNTADNLMVFKLLLASQFATLVDYANRTSSQIPQVENQDNGTKDEMSLRELIEKFQVEMTILKNDQEQGAISPLDALVKSYNYSTVQFVAIRERLKANQDAAKKDVSNLEESLKILESGEGASK